MTAPDGLSVIHEDEQQARQALVAAGPMAPR
jgi:hypothetical protein